MYLPWTWYECGAHFLSFTHSSRPATFCNGSQTGFIPYLNDECWVFFQHWGLRLSGELQHFHSRHWLHTAVAQRLRRWCRAWGYIHVWSRNRHDRQTSNRILCHKHEVLLKFDFFFNSFVGMVTWPGHGPSDMAWWNGIAQVLLPSTPIECESVSTHRLTQTLT